MWDNPRLLNSAAGLLVVVAALLFAFAGLQLLLQSPLFPLRELEVDRGLKHTTRQEVEAAVRGHLDGNFFAVDLSGIRAALEQLPWVRRVTVRRLGPAGTEQEVARRYAHFASLVAPLGTSLERVVLTPRYAWQLRLASGLNIMLGRDADSAELRLARFVAAYPETLGRIERRHAYVDLRYPNGFALRAPELRG